MTSLDTQRHEAPRRVDHRHYIEAARAALVAGSIAIGDPITVSEPHEHRTARLTLQVDEDEHVHGADVELTLDWDEELGWSFSALPPTDLSHSGARFFHGIGPVLDPDRYIVPWVATLLAAPFLEDSLDDGPYRRWTDTDQDFEAQLEAYVTTPHVA
jgi:hypothetical protein